LIIVHSSISCASACGGNQARETLRFRSVIRSEQRRYLCDNEGASPNPARGKLDSASLHQMLAANLPNRVKLATSREVMNTCTCWVSRGDWRERVPTEYPRYPGDPSRCVSLGVSEGQSTRGSHNPQCLRRRKSERLILVLTRGNARRAKGPCHDCVFKTKGGSA
jgi:hypothetical protein